MTTRVQPRRSSEDGYILIGVMILLALFIIAMAVAVPRISASIQRDRDVETMQRGKQYIRAIKLYYKKFNAYPPNIDALVKTNEIRFLRKRYLDPITGKDDWKPVMFGQNKTPMAMGFFGQPLGLGGNIGAGIGPGGMPGTNNLSGSSDASATSPTGSSLTTGTNPTINPTTGSTNDPGAAGTTSPTGSSSTTGGSTGPIIGGAIIGVSPGSSKQSILIYKKKNHYNEWEFLYSPLSDMQQIGGASGGLGPTGPTGGPTGPPAGTGGPTGPPTGTGGPPNPTTPPQQ